MVKSNSLPATKSSAATRREAGLRRHGHRRADHADHQSRVLGLERLGDLDVAGEGRRARVHDAEVVLARQRPDIVQREAVRWSVDQSRAWDERRRLGEPRWIPEGADLPLRLVARAGAAVEALAGRRVEEERAEIVGRHARPTIANRGLTGHLDVPAASAAPGQRPELTHRASGRSRREAACTRSEGSVETTLRRGSRGGHQQDGAARQPRRGELVGRPEHTRAVGEGRADAQHAAPRVHQHRTAARVELERARVLDWALVGQQHVRLCQVASPRPPCPSRRGRRRHRRGTASRPASRPAWSRPRRPRSTIRRGATR